MTALVQYERARAVLAEASRIDQVLPLLDEFELAKVRARQIKDHALLADATELELRAERRLGEVIKAAKEAGLFLQGRQPAPEKSTEPELSSPRPTLAEAGIDKKLSARAQGRASIAEQAFELMVQSTRDRIASGRAKIIEPEPINGARAIMGSRQEPDESLDYFPTPPFGTRALIERVFHHHLGLRVHDQTAWEPSCGEGHMAEVLREYFREVTASDIHDYGYGHVADFLAPDLVPGTDDWIIFNPPFGEKTEAFVLRALDWARVGVAAFVRLQWLETIGRYERLFRDRPPTLIAFFCERVNLCKGRWEPDGGTATAYIWLVWVKGMAPRAPFWIPPGCREGLTRPDDRERFTARPVVKKDHPFDAVGVVVPHDDNTGEVIDLPPLPRGEWRKAMQELTRIGTQQP